MNKSNCRWHSGVWLAAGLGLASLVPACNFVVGGAAVTAVGGLGYLSWQCYDHVAVRVRDMSTAQLTCDAQVVIQSLDDESISWTLQPCYHVALTEGRYSITARLAGFEPTTSEVTIPERAGACPHYTHSLEMSLWQPGKARTGNQLRVRQRQVADKLDKSGDSPPSLSKPLPPTIAFELSPKPAVAKPTLEPAPKPAPSP